MAPPSSSSYLKDIEKIYSFENIDPTSVKKISSKNPTEKQNKEIPQQDPFLDLFPTASFRFKEQEPLESLQLAPFTMKAIRTLALKNVGELQKMLMGDRSRMRSIGQGHVDEIESKVNQFLKKALQPNTPKADLASCLRCVLAPLSSKEQARIALVYGLKSLCFLAHGEEKEAEMSLRQVPVNKREESVSSLKAKLITHSDDIFSLLYDHFTLPALVERRGLASIPTLTLLLYSESGLSSFSQFQALNRFFLSLTEERLSPWFASKGHPIGQQFIALSSPLAKTASDILTSIKTLAALCPTTVKNGSQSIAALETSRNAQNFILDDTALLQDGAVDSLSCFATCSPKPSLHELASLLWKQQAHRWQDLDRTVLFELLYWTRG